LGLPFEIVPSEGPVLARSIRSQADLATLRPVHPESHLDYLLSAIGLVCRELGGRVPLIGFAGAPLTLACYAVEGGPSKEFTQVRRMSYEAPELLEGLLDRLAEAVTATLLAQVRAGVSAIQLFESWGGVLPPELYRRFVLPRLQRIFAALGASGVPRILYMGHTTQQLAQLAESGADVISVDWRQGLTAVRRGLGAPLPLQGNLDPCALYAPPEELVRLARAVLESARGLPGHIFNLGHGIFPDVDPDQVSRLVDCVHEFTPRQGSAA
jgi:uroporphyrinogen decarboxylase